MKRDQLWVWLSLILGAGNKEFQTLWEEFGSIDGIYEADHDGYISCNISERLSERLSDKGLSAAREICAYCERNGVGLLAFDDPMYPSSLKGLKDPPVLLYFMGQLPNFNRELCISVVGTRKMSEYGMNTAYKIAYEMAAAGAVVVSGMALGIDGVAACGAISAGGKTVAVLGSGIDVIYPREHTTLYRIITHNGAVITEFPPSTSPSGINFPMRNRIISGLSQGTLVVDADTNSGAMITAKNAILQGRDIYAVPGNIDARNTSGTNMLIRDGAQAALSGKDIIKNYAYIYKDSINMLALSRAQKSSDIDMRAVRDMEISIRYVKREDKKDIALPQTSDTLMERRRTEKAREVKKDSAPAKEAVNAKNGGDKSIEILNSLSDRQRAIFNEIPLDKPISADGLIKLGFSMGEIMSSLTVLEIKGLVSSLPGALYIRK